jgi:hypothetical protein
VPDCTLSHHKMSVASAAFSSEVDAGSREENARQQKQKA